MDGDSFNVSFRRLYELAENKLVTMTNMFSLDWDVGNEAWK